MLAVDVAGWGPMAGYCRHSNELNCLLMTQTMGPLICTNKIVYRFYMFRHHAIKVLLLVSINSLVRSRCADWLISRTAVKINFITTISWPTEQPAGCYKGYSHGVRYYYYYYYYYYEIIQWGVTAWLAVTAYRARWPKRSAVSNAECFFLPRQWGSPSL